MRSFDRYVPTPQLPSAFDLQYPDRCPDCLEILWDSYGGHTPRRCVKCASRADNAPTDARPAAEQRFHRRHDALWFASVRDKNKDAECVVRNVSLGGAKLTLLEDLVPCSPLTLSIPGVGDFCGEIAWCRLESMGIRFLEQPQLVAQAVGLPNMIEAA